MFLGSIAVAQDPSPDLRIEYSGSPDVAIIEYDVDANIGRTDKTPRLRIYGDGSVRVHHPPYTVMAGDYEMKLSENEVSNLLRLLHENGAMMFDDKAVAVARREAELAQARAARDNGAPLVIRTDPVTSLIRIRLDFYQPASAAAPQTNVVKEIRCVDLQHDAEANPQIVALRGMANAENALIAIVEDGRLRRVAGTP
jgi:hypothetical protein